MLCHAMWCYVPLLFLASSEDWIHTMIKGSCVYVPKAVPKERSPELEKLMDGYKAQVAEKDYRRMVSSIDRDSPNSAASSTIAYNLRQDMKDLKDVKAHTIGIVNVLYTGAAVFTAVFMISGHFTEDLGKRVLLAFLGFVLIVMCETYLYMRHAQVASETGSGSAGKRTKKVPEDVVIASRVIGKEKKA
ncbi:MAG: endoplasmic reticulum-based factor for assembly of V-ATPase-domain-containing protein [Linnemannia gamsii]|nr:MAG: endoplasmic reticulum-based factor for assembly of V-ATPase-domain-containing protein [Linnemannia gamsii]